MPVSPVLPINLSNGFKLDPKQAREIGASLSSDYCFAEPFPHIVLDNFLPEDLISGLYSHFPKERLDSDVVFESGYAGHHKRQVLPADCDDFCRRSFDFFNSQPFLEFLEGLSAIDGLLPDPYFVGGGFHETGPGGKLGVHADFNLHTKLNVRRRINAIVYLNRDWPDAYGGKLELWDTRMQHCEKAVAPLFNRCVIFNTDDTSFHGHPDPLTCPPDRTRRSLALYYYTASTGIQHEFRERTTDFRARPGSGDRIDMAVKSDAFIREVLPPALYRGWRRVAGRVQRARDTRTPV